MISSTLDPLQTTPTQHSVVLGQIGSRVKKSFLPLSWKILTTDASLEGWGGVLDILSVQVTQGVQASDLSLQH